MGPPEPQTQERCPACNLPYTTENMVECDECELWYHYLCVGVDDTIAKQDWKCNRCEEKVKNVPPVVKAPMGESTESKKAGTSKKPEATPDMTLQATLDLLTEEQSALADMRRKYAELAAAHEKMSQEYGAVKRLIVPEDSKLDNDQRMQEQFQQAWENRSRRSDSDRKKADAGSRSSSESWESQKLQNIAEKVNVQEPSVQQQSSELSQLAILMKQAHVEDLPRFAGDAKNWPLFLAVYKRTTALASIDDVTNVGRLTKALEGEARDLVLDQLTFGMKPKEILQTLEKRYGRKDVVLKTLTTELLDFPILNGQRDPRMQRFAVSLKTYVAQLKSLKLERNLKSDLVEALLLDKLANIPSMYRKWKTKKDCNEELDLEDFASFVMREWENLPSSAVAAGNRDRNFEKGAKPQTKFVNLHDTSGSDLASCPICEGNHTIDCCFKFKKLDVAERWEAVKRARLCFSCLNAKSHRFAECPEKSKCSEAGCDKYHHRMLHASSSTNPIRYPKAINSGLNATAGEFDPNQRQSSRTETQQNPQTSFHQTHAGETTMVNAKVVPVRIFGNNGAVVNDFAFLDDGSTLTMMNQEIADKLGIVGEPEKLVLQWTKGITRVEEATRCDVTLAGARGKEKFNLRGVYCVPSLELSPVSQPGTDLANRYRHLQRLPLPNFKNARPGILIGLEHATLLGGKHVHEGEIDEPLAAKTKLGWIVYGRHGTISAGASATAVGRQGFQQCHLRLVKPSNDEEIELHELVKGFFGIESVGIAAKKPKSSDDKRAEMIMRNTLRFVNGQYEIGLLWKTDDEKLPDNSRMAENRLESEERKLSKDPDSLVWMNEKIQSLVDKNYARKATAEDLDTVWNRVWTCPLFTVINRNKIPPKRRCVADVAAVERGISLNSCLLKGPDNLIALPAALCRARENPVMVTADVAEMFHQIRISKEDQQVQRFLWRDGDKSKPPTTYVMQAMMFGPTCSPSQAQFVKNVHAEKYRDKYPEAAEALVRYMYMDDYFNSHKTTAEAIRVTTNAIDICAEMGFDLVQVQSSHAEVLRQLPQRHLKPELVSLNIDENSTYVTKLLGMFWNPAEDAFVFKRTFDDLLEQMIELNKIPTKREALSTLMKFFDPLGLISKYIVRGKWILQDVWREKIGWDEKIPENLAGEWLRFLRAFDEIERVKIPRWYGGADEETELIIFVDASAKAYAAVGYFRFSLGGTARVALVMGKTKVAPVKPMSIPRLELEAAKLGARLASSIVNLHSFPISRRFFLSDSKCVLLQINSGHFKYDTFVAHRLGEIAELTEPEEWWHVPTDQNVADDATKENESEATRDRWFNGAEFLRLPVEEWPIERVDRIAKRREVENQIHCRLTPYQKGESFIYGIGWRFRCHWKRLVRVTARILRVRTSLCQQKKFEDDALSVMELETAENEIFKIVQQETLFEHWEEFAAQTAEPNQKVVHGTLKKLPGAQSLTLKLLMEEGILRLESRDRTSGKSYSSRNPILLPKHHEFVQLYLQHLHEENYHMGIESTIADARKKVWVLSMRQALMTTIANCQYCKNRKANPLMPTMGKLHESRTAFGWPPFTFVGVDCFGPLIVREKRSDAKRWGVIFTCLTYRAVHLEVVQDLSSDQMLLAVRRMSARRGRVQTLYSDNGLNFKGAANILKEEIRVAQQTLKRNAAEKMNLEWRFIPAYSPWMGGAWERLIGYIKKCIMFCLAGETPSESVLQNTLIEAELLANKRPLTHTPVDPDDDEPLNPNVALFGEDDAPQALCPIEDRNQFARLSRKRVAHLVEKFRLRWEKEYLPVIAKPEITDQKQRPVQVGDVVLVTEGEVDRDNWKLGRISRIHPSSDNVPRIVDVKMGTGETKHRRALGNLAVLEVGESKSH